jgi:hypothetical protein
MRMQDFADLNTGSGAWLLFGDSVAGAVQFSVFLNQANYAVQIYRGDGRSGGTLLGLSDNNVWIGGTSIFIEVGAKVDNSSGYVTVKMNGVVLKSVTSVDTQSTANAWFDVVDFQPSPLDLFRIAQIDLDDIRYNDTATGPGGFAADGFLGDARVATSFVTGNNAVQWSPLSGSNNQMVDEVAMDSDTTYNYSSNAGDEDTFAFQPITNTIGIIYGVQLTFAARKDDAGSRVVKPVLICGGTTDYGADHSLPDTYAYFSDVWILNPDTAANWTRTEFNALAGGYNLVS